MNEFKLIKINMGTYRAVNGLEAIQKAEKQPDIILLDINMPDID